MRHRHFVGLVVVALLCASAPAGASADTATSLPDTRCVQNSAGEFGTRYCVSTTDSCVVSEYRWGGVEGTYTCFLRRP